MSPLTWQQFASVLDEEYEEEQKQQQLLIDNKDSIAKQQQHDEKLEQAIQDVWEHLGILITPSSKETGSDNNNHHHERYRNYWQRPIPDYLLYRSPVSTAQTTLVDWNTLPQPLRTKLQQSGWVSLEAIIDCTTQPHWMVEVPINYLSLLEQSKNDESGTSSSLVVMGQNRRPLQGNLSDKLSEYTRGIAGQSNKTQTLFRPGGFDTNEVNTAADDDDDTTTVDPYRTPEAMERARAVLDIGSEQAWLDKTIVTAPPGVNYKVGISWKDVYGQDHPSEVVQNEQQQQRQQSNEGQEIESYDDDYSVGQQQRQNLSTSSSLPTTTTAAKGMFSRGYFDDDSLFGSSSSSSEDSDDDNDADDEDKDDKDSTIDDGDDGDDDAYNATDTNKIQTQLESLKLNENKVDENAILDGSEIDKLLLEMTINDTNTILEKKMKKNTKEDDNVDDGEDDIEKRNIYTNPLQLITKQKLDQNNTTRKVWASTKLLPIRDFNTYVPNPALKYPFQLDDFQQQAIARLERSESVFVAAHTSAGKTVVAEYAVALAMQRSTRCVYTSPIKALSNQKYRDFCLKFGSQNVGLVTGDLQVNVDSSTCLIMTTEILRSMLYRGADLIRDIESVIFDEVHYINDTERGVVWEEVIIMLPSYVNLIFLSATTPNTLEFSDWIGKTKRKPVHVVKTNYRPVPLSHHLWAGTKLHKIMEGNGPFQEAGYTSAVNGLLPQSAKDPNKKKSDQKGGGKPQTGGKQLAWQGQGSKQNWMSLVRYLEKELLTPTVVFVFSKKKCEETANMLSSLDLNTAKERSAVMSFTIQTVSRLSQNDSKLPQVLTVCEMVQRGIGIHHGGLLPILKEMVEILFSRNLIKVLFATETFAMGVNMPAKAVVFFSIRKHDGSQFRVLEPGEYTQMAGRAGRRGLDKVGTVIICCFGECPPPQPILRQMLTGTSMKLTSQFRLTYNMILNLLKVEEISVESMIKRSFSEFATQRALTANEYPQLLARGTKTLAKLEEQFRQDEVSRIGAEDLVDYFSICTKLHQANSEVFSYIRDNDSVAFEDLFQSGRILFVTAARQFGAVCSPAIVLKAPGTSTSLRAVDTDNSKITSLILLPSSYTADETQQENKKVGTVGYRGTSQQRHYIIEEITLDQVVMVSNTKRRNVDTKSLLKQDEKGMAIDSQWKGFSSIGSKANDPFAGMKAMRKKGDDSIGNPLAKEMQLLDQVVGYLIESEQNEFENSTMDIIELHSFVKRGNQVVNIRQVCDYIYNSIHDMRSCSSHRHPSLAKLYTVIERIETLRSKVDTLRHLLSNESLQLFPDFLQRKAVLRKLGYVDHDETVCVKGRVACEVNTCEELIATEMVFEGLLNDLEPEEIAAVLSALVYQEKNTEEGFDSELPERLVHCCQNMKTIAVNLGQLQKEHGLDVDPGEYCDKSLNFGLVHVVYEWAMGVPFKNICDLTTTQEGSIVRCITRLDELCREIRNCARVVGNPTLYRKLEAASAAIKRDIVFASSLYVS